MAGLFATLGPFKVTNEGKLIENLFGWTKVGNVLFLEAPSGVGFSYTSDDGNTSQIYNDTLVYSY